MERPIRRTAPLHGKRIVVTRSAEQADAFGEQLTALGGRPLFVPTIAFVPLPAPGLAAALRHPAVYAWLLFTSANAVRFFFARTADGAILPPLAAIGPATAAALTERGCSVAAMPAEYSGEALALALGDVNGRRILLPRAKQGRPEIVDSLIAQGAQVDEFALYDTTAAELTPALAAELAQGVDVLTFTSPSTVHNFFAAAGLQAAHGATIACIGPTTASAAAALGLHVAIVPTEHTTAGLLAALLAYYDHHKDGTHAQRDDQ